jgi:hypothetical protein
MPSVSELGKWDEEETYRATPRSSFPCLLCPVAVRLIVVTAVLYTSRVKDARFSRDSSGVTEGLVERL